MTLVLREVFREVFNWLSLPVLGVLAVILVWRKLAAKFPLFFSYVVVAFVIDGARLLAYRGSRNTYYYVYWISEALESVFAFLATGELALKRLFPQFRKVRFYRYLFLFAILVSVFFAVVTARTNATQMFLPKLIQGLHTFDFLRAALLLFIVGLMVFMGRSWGQYELGIAVGLGLDAAAFLASFAAWTKSWRTFLDQLPLIAYNAACVIWLITFLRPEKPQPLPTGPVDPQVVREARQTQQELKDLLSKKSKDAGKGSA